MCEAVKKNNKYIVVTIVLIVQTVLAISSGLLALNSSKKDRIPPNVYVGSVFVGNKTKAEAIALIKEHFDSKISNGKLVIDCGNGKDYFIKYSDINAVPDYDKTIMKAFNNNSNRGYLINLINDFFSSRERVVYPEMTFDKEVLAKRIDEVALLVYKPAKDAQVGIMDNKVVKIEEEKGLKLNTNKTIEMISDEIGKSLEAPLELTKGPGGEITVIEPYQTLEKLKGLDEIIAVYSTEIKKPNIEEDVLEAVKAIDSVTVFPKSDANSENNNFFSFNKCLRDSGIEIESVNDGYNIVASTLYAVLLKTDIGIDSIKRSKNQNSVDYILPGLDVKIDGQKNDLVFVNTLTYPIKIFAEIKDQKLNVSLIGKGKGEKNDIEIGYSIVQRFIPSVVTTVNYDLKPGEKKWLYRGKEGIEVEVYKNTRKNGNKIKELLYVDKYEAVDAILQTSPDVQDIKNDDTK